MRRLWLVWAWLLAGSWATSFIVPIEGEIDPALAVFIEQSLSRAEREGATGVVFLIDTPGGRADAMIRISDAIVQSPLPTLSVVKNAYSAGSLIALSAEQVAMLPGSEIGAALPIVTVPGLEPTPVEEKSLSAFKGKFRAVAEARGRPAELMEAMVDPRVEIEGLTGPDEPLTLSARQAVEEGIADFQVASLREALLKAGFAPETQEVDVPATVAIARFLSRSTVAPILLAVGILGLLAELFVPGFGVPGIIGLVSLSLYFLGGILAGLAGSAEIILFVVGLILIVVEFLVTPGFGVPGILGLAAILGSVYLTFEDQALMVIGISLILVILGLVILFRYLPRARVARPLVNQDMLSVAGVGEYQNLLGAIGQALTDLRPAGLAQFGERRVDVVSRGDYITKGTSVRIVEIEGNRVVVEKIGG